MKKFNALVERVADKLHDGRTTNSFICACNAISFSRDDEEKSELGLYFQMASITAGRGGLAANATKIMDSMRLNAEYANRCSILISDAYQTEGGIVEARLKRLALNK